MLAFDLTPWNLFWVALVAWSVWMCVVILMFAIRHESRNWEQY